MSSNKVKILGPLIVLIGLACVIELLSFVLLNNVKFFSSFIYERPAVSITAIANYMESRDELTGWPTKQWLANEADKHGARLSPANDVLSDKPVCISVFGDSFAFSDEVDQASAWANQLANILGCRVNNFGVSGYGTDQAVLRYESMLKNKVDVGKTIILTFIPDDLNRNVNQWRYLLDSDPFTFKPVFQKSGDKFKLVPVPINDANDVSAIHDMPESTLKAEQFAPNSSHLKSKMRSSFFYSFTLVRIVTRIVLSINPARFGWPLRYLNYPAWYDSSAGPTQEKMETFNYVLNRFNERCAKENKKCILLLIPDGDVFYSAIRTAQHDFAGIRSQLPKDLHFIDVTDALVKAFDSRYCDFLTQPKSCRGHFSATGNLELAKIVRRSLRDLSDVNGVVPAN